MAHGYQETKRTGRLKIAVNFPAELFRTIAARADREKRSFSAEVVELCKVGELDLSESDSLEVATV